MHFHLLRGVSESLAGRAIYLTLHPMHRRELRGAIRPTPLVRELFEHGTLPRRPEAAPLDPTELLRGGMPTVALGHVREPDIWVRGFEQTYLERDLRDLTQVADLTAFRTLLRLSALRTGQVLNQSVLARDARLTVATTTRYLSLLETSFLVARLPSYRTSRVSRLIKAPKLHFEDAGLAAYLSGVRALMPVADEPMAGALLETYVYQHGLLQRVQRKDLQGRPGGMLGLFGSHVLAEQPGQAFERQLVQALALHDPPFLERRFVDAEAVQEVALVQSGARSSAVTVPSSSAISRSATSTLTIPDSSATVVLVGEEHGFAERPPQARQRLPEVLSGLGFRCVSPEERGQLVAGVRTSEGQREIREEGEPTKELEMHQRHSGWREAREN